MEYYYFGDVVSFDTTYKTNKYGKPFAPFVGVNHHYQSVLFGCALLQNEDFESFAWLFRTWLEAMSNRPPSAMITDQDKAMTKAISIVFPNTRHRLCMWHIMKKFPEKLPTRVSDEFREKLKTCIHKSRTVDEFETTWEELLEKFGMSDNEWLKDLYEIREKWIPAYLRDHFFAKMSSTSRSESINSFFDGFVHANTSLHDFVQQYAHAVDCRFGEENQKDYESRHKFVQLSSCFPIEKHASKIYTHAMFRKFEKQFRKSQSLIAEEESSKGEELKFLVTHHADPQISFNVLFNCQDKQVSCTCRHFEFTGILCQHILQIYIKFNVMEIPPQYILKRWTEDAKNGDVIDDKGGKTAVDCNENLSIRYIHFYQMIHPLAKRAIQYPQMYALAVKYFKLMEDEMDAFENSMTQNVDTVGTNLQIHTQNEPDNEVSGLIPSIDICDPITSRSKGRIPMARRLKSGIYRTCEEAPKKM